VQRPGLLLAVVDSCPDCHAWGVTRTTGWLCKGCAAWRAAHPSIAPCGGCGRKVNVDDRGVCRLCLRQRSLRIRAGERGIDLREANRHGQQLFLADMLHRVGSQAARHASDSGAEIPAAGPRALDIAGVIAPVRHRQLVLLDLPRDLRAGMRHGFPPPPDPSLQAALACIAAEHAERHGWKRTLRERVQRALRILLGTQDTPGAPIAASTVMELSSIRHPVRPVLDVLDAAGLLADDRVPAVVAWASKQTAGLPEQMRRELTVWLEVMRAGSSTPPRIRPRADATIKILLGFALPTLRAWARTHASLREIGRDDVRAALPASGTSRSTTLQGLRSIFRVLKARKLVFVNLTARIGAPAPDRAAPAAVDLDALRAALDPADPTRAALAALLAFHGLRLRELPILQLTDVRDGRLHLPDRIVPLAEPARERLQAYLGYRQRTWPGTANPHLFISIRSANTTIEASPWWIRKRLGMSGQAIRQDRILDEAFATGGDVRMLCELFGLSIAGANRYTSTVGDQVAVSEFAHDGR
jgi:site-specific recombinase XerD